MPDSTSRLDPEQVNPHMVRLVFLASVTVGTLYLGYQVIKPLVGVLTWSAALALLSGRLHQWIGRRIQNRGFAAGATVCVLFLGLIIPMVLLGHGVVREGTREFSVFYELAHTKGIDGLIEGNQVAKRLYLWLTSWFDLRSELQSALSQLRATTIPVIASSVWGAIECILVFFTLFFLLRDGAALSQGARALLPFSQQETALLCKRVSDTVFAAVFGTLAVAALQGALGGAMFWMLGLPAPVLWGVTMALLAVFPYLGAFVIWIPAALLLAAEGRWTGAAVLSAWGAIVIAFIDNLLYPIFVSARLHQHTLLVFFFMLGGLTLFGAKGFILGPTVLSILDTLRIIWYARMRG